MLAEIALTPHPSRKFKVLLDNRECTFFIYQKASYLYLDLTVNGQVLCHGAICLNLVPIVQVANNLLQGNLFFVDSLGEEKPNFSGLGKRFFLVYYSKASDLAALSQESGQGN